MLSLPTEPTGSYFFLLYRFLGVDSLYLEAQRLLAIQQEFLPLEDNLLSLSRLEAELHARLVVSQTTLELDISSYNQLKSKYYFVINSAAELAK